MGRGARAVPPNGARTSAVLKRAIIIREAKEAPPVDACYRFDEGEERFAGVVDDVCRIGASKVRITLSTAGAECERLRAVRGEDLGRAA